jgi:hypothetical protein
MMQHLLVTWQDIGIGAGMLFAILVVMQRAFDSYANVSPGQIADFRPQMDRTRERERKDTIGKDVTGYDAVAVQQLKRLDERRRKINLDSGRRRRATDR